MASPTRQNASRVLQIFAKSKEGLKTKIADGAARLVGITELLKASDEEWSALSEHVAQYVACVLAARPSPSNDGDKLKEHWDNLQMCMQQVENACNKRVQRNKVTVVPPAADAQHVAVLRRKFDDAFGLFKLNLDLKNFAEIENYLGSLNIEDLGQSIASKVKEEFIPQAVDTLPYAIGASWDPDKACLLGTRDNWLDSIWEFINAADGATCAQIFWLVDVAGSGKTAIAHSVCQRAEDAQVLVTSYFFDRMSAERDNPDKFVTTMARDLASRDTRIATAMASALKHDPSLRSTSITRQFDRLIAQPSVKALGKHQERYVFVLDGLDEGLGRDEKLAALLSTRVRDLPANFRFLVTSRPIPAIAYMFDKVPHIHKRTLNLRGTRNQIDITTYMTHRLVEVASKRRKRLPWPDPELTLQLVMKSEGHFLWASAVTEFLGRATNPDGQLKALLSMKGASNTEAKMDQLYAAVLRTCPWDEDEDFSQGYHMFMGAIVAAKEPLTGNAIRDLHGIILQPDAIFEKLGSLITGFDVEDEPVRPLHLSLQEYLTLRAPSPYHLVEKEHSQRLAVLCMRVVNREFNVSLASVDNFRLDAPEYEDIPKLAADLLSETTRYACRFWPVHLMDVDVLSSEVMECLHPVIATHLVPWMKLCVCMGEYQSLGRIRDWLHKTIPEDGSLIHHVYDIQLSSILEGLGWRLRRSGRREEALLAAEDGVSTARHNLDTKACSLQVAQDVGILVPTIETVRVSLREDGATAGQDGLLITSEQKDLRIQSDDKRLARSLTLHSACLSDMGLRADALKSIDEAVQLYRRLIEQQAVAILPELAKVLRFLSNRLTDVGRRPEALNAIEESVQLYRSLMQAQASTFTAELAGSLNTVSNCLSDLGRREEALQAIKEAVQLRRTLAQEQATAFTPDLARSLSNLSNRLCEVGQLQEALDAIEEAVQLNRELSQSQAVGVTPDLAMSVMNMGIRLHEVGRRKEAVKASDEAVQLYRALVQRQDQSTAFTPFLGRSLNNLALFLGNVGRPEEASKAIAEAVQLYRALVQDQADAFVPDLANCLDTLASRMGDFGRPEEALTAIVEAVRLRRALVLSHPAAFTPDLAASLQNLASRLADVGRPHAALKAVQESIQMYRPLVQNQDAAFTPGLAEALDNLASRLGDMGRREEALKAARESVQLYLSLVQTQAGAFTPDLAKSLYKQSIYSSGTGQHQEALISAQDAINLYRPLAAELPAVFNVWLKKSSKRLSEVYSFLGRNEESELHDRVSEG